MSDDQIDTQETNQTNGIQTSGHMAVDHKVEPNLPMLLGMAPLGKIDFSLGSLQPSASPVPLVDIQTIPPINITAVHPINTTTISPMNISADHLINISMINPINLTAIQPIYITTPHPINITTLHPITTVNLLNITSTLYTTPSTKQTTTAITRKIVTRKHENMKSRNYSSIVLQICSQEYSKMATDYQKVWQMNLPEGTLMGKPNGGSGVEINHNMPHPEVTNSGHGKPNTGSDKPHNVVDGVPSQHMEKEPMDKKQNHNTDLKDKNVSANAQSLESHKIEETKKTPNGNNSNTRRVVIQQAGQNEPQKSMPGQTNRNMGLKVEGKIADNPLIGNDNVLKGSLHVETDNKGNGFMNAQHSFNKEPKDKMETSHAGHKLNNATNITNTHDHVNNAKNITNTNGHAVIKPTNEKIVNKSTNALQSKPRGIKNIGSVLDESNVGSSVATPNAKKQHIVGNNVENSGNKTNPPNKMDDKKEISNNPDNKASQISREIPKDIVKDETSQNNSNTGDVPPDNTHIQTKKSALGEIKDDKQPKEEVSGARENKNTLVNYVEDEHPINPYQDYVLTTQATRINGGIPKSVYEIPSASRSLQQETSTSLSYLEKAMEVFASTGSSAEENPSDVVPNEELQTTGSPQENLNQNIEETGNPEDSGSVSSIPAVEDQNISNINGQKEENPEANPQNTESPQENIGETGNQPREHQLDQLNEGNNEPATEGNMEHVTEGNNEINNDQVTPGNNEQVSEGNNEPATEGYNNEQVTEGYNEQDKPANNAPLTEGYNDQGNPGNNEHTSEGYNNEQVTEGYNDQGNPGNNEHASEGYNNEQVTEGYNDQGNPGNNEHPSEGYNNEQVTEGYNEHISELNNEQVTEGYNNEQVSEGYNDQGNPGKNEHASEGYNEQVTEGYNNEQVTEGYNNEQLTEGNNEHASEGYNEQVTEGNNEYASEGNEQVTEGYNNEPATEGYNDQGNPGNNEHVSELNNEKVTEGYYNEQVSEGYNDQGNPGNNEHASEGYNEQVTEGYNNEQLTEGNNEHASEGYNEQVTEGNNEHASEGNEQVTEGYNNEPATEGYNDQGNPGNNEHASEGYNNEQATEGYNDQVTGGNNEQVNSENNEQATEGNNEQVSEGYNDQVTTQPGNDGVEPVNSDVTNNEHLDLTPEPGSLDVTVNPDEGATIQDLENAQNTGIPDNTQDNPSTEPNVEDSLTPEPEPQQNNQDNANVNPDETVTSPSNGNGSEQVSEGANNLNETEKAENSTPEVQHNGENSAVLPTEQNRDNLQNGQEEVTPSPDGSEVNADSTPSTEVLQNDKEQTTESNVDNSESTQNVQPQENSEGVQNTDGSPVHETEVTSPPSEGENVETTCNPDVTEQIQHNTDETDTGKPNKEEKSDANIENVHNGNEGLNKQDNTNNNVPMDLQTPLKSSEDNKLKEVNLQTTEASNLAKLEQPTEKKKTIDGNEPELTKKISNDNDNKEALLGGEPINSETSPKYNKEEVLYSTEVPYFDKLNEAEEKKSNNELTPNNLSNHTDTKDETQPKVEKPIENKEENLDTPNKSEDGPTLNKVEQTPIQTSNTNFTEGNHEVHKTDKGTDEKTEHLEKKQDESNNLPPTHGDEHDLTLLNKLHEVTTDQTLTNDKQENSHLAELTEGGQKSSPASKTSLNKEELPKPLDNQKETPHEKVEEPKEIATFDKENTMEHKPQESGTELNKEVGNVDLTGEVAIKKEKPQTILKPQLVPSPSKDLPAKSDRTQLSNIETDQTGQISPQGSNQGWGLFNYKANINPPAPVANDEGGYFKDFFKVVRTTPTTTTSTTPKPAQPAKNKWSWF
ncbi:hypothetical protein M8J75_012218 [Diaphorina citri]|nr:hypothetical protein M8J75_012218 [Diaphorina citri]